MYNKICEICGSDYLARRYDQKCCSMECSLIRNRERNKELQRNRPRNYRAERLARESRKKPYEKVDTKKPKKTENNEERIKELNRRARAVGMSYGKYVALLEMGVLCE